MSKCVEGCQRECARCKNDREGASWGKVEGKIKRSAAKLINNLHKQDQSEAVVTTTAVMMIKGMVEYIWPYANIDELKSCLLIIPLHKESKASVRRWLSACDRWIDQHHDEFPDPDEQAVARFDHAATVHLKTVIAMAAE